MDTHHAGYVFGERWMVIKKLGSGGMGDVFLVSDSQLGNDQVALKVLRLDHFTPEMQEIAHREVLLARKLSHEGIARVFDFHDNRYITMEYIPGISLEKYLARGTTSVVPFVTSVIQQLAAALDYAHQNDICHLDVKPHNIMLVGADDSASADKLASDVAAKLIDFGFARALSLATGRINGGSVPYAAPERLGGRYLPQSDTYSVGILAYQLLTGQLPFRRARDRGEELPGDLLPPVVQSAIARATSPDPDDRWSTVRDFSDALLEACEECLRDIAPKAALLLPLPMASPMDMPQLAGRCICCGTVHRPYNPNKRYCCTEGIQASELGLAQGDVSEHLFPTVFPIEPLESTSDSSVFIPPAPGHAASVDGLAIASHDSTRQGDVLVDTSATIPFLEGRDALSAFRCGHAVIHKLKSHADRFGFESVTLCDMSTYPWSGTLKDPRSWAIVKTALRYGIKHLGLWTAGNAGLSLARIAHAANTLLPAKERLRVYCYAIKKSLSSSMVASLRSFRAEVVEFERPEFGRVILPTHARARLNSSLSLEIREDEYWDVSDGWDGVGLYMYRLLGRQLVVHEKPDYIVAPVGTGNLLLGLSQGVEDCESQGAVEKGACKLIGAVPWGVSVVENFRKYGMDISVKNARVARAAAPSAKKLVTVYTPLLLALYSALKRGRFELRSVTRQDQSTARDILIRDDRASAIAVEPSSLISASSAEFVGEFRLG